MILRIAKQNAGSQLVNNWKWQKVIILC